MDHGWDKPELSKVTKRLNNNEGKPIGTLNYKPILDSQMYDIEFSDRFYQPVAANVIAKISLPSLLRGGRHILLEMIVDVCKNEEALNEADTFVVSSNGIKLQRPATKGW